MQQVGVRVFAKKPRTPTVYCLLWFNWISGDRALPSRWIADPARSFCSLGGFAIRPRQASP